jgi:tRNA uridine 5-carboxymethylaminomethyl modification enzyme
LTTQGLEIGCVGHRRAQAWAEKENALSSAREKVEELSMTPNELKKLGLPVNLDGQRRSAFDLLRYPEIGWGDVCRIWPDLGGLRRILSSR